MNDTIELKFELIFINLTNNALNGFRDAIGDRTAEEFLENEDSDIFGHEFIDLRQS